ncbi:MAG: glutamyl-tRNA reductase [Deltaproteobacteria bacterium]|nr:glutamyl-tRNA reductase [Deltaproteobacteria bacterium]
MDIFIIGVGHRSAPVALRERLAKCDLGDGRGLLGLFASGLIDEGLVISTCNRLEIVVVTAQAEPAQAEIFSLMARMASISVAELQSCAHVFRDEEAVGYLFRVASGLDSQILGEPQILGQVKEAYRLAARRRTVGPVISKLFHRSFKTAKRIRSETSLASGSVSMASAATAMAASLAGGLASKNAYILGAGEMAQLVAAHLKTKGVESLTLFGRNVERAAEMAGKLGTKAASLADLPKMLPQADILIAAAGAEEPLITVETWREAAAQTDGPQRKNLTVVDLGVPRNVAADVGEIEGVTLRNVDDLSEVVRRNQSKRLQQADQASLIVAEEVEKFSLWLTSLATNPTVKDLINQAEQARSLEMDRTVSKHDFSAEEIKALEAMSKSLVRRLLHNPLIFVKSCHRHGRSDYSLNMFRRVFGLEP